MTLCVVPKVATSMNIIYLHVHTAVHTSLSTEKRVSLIRKWMFGKRCSRNNCGDNTGDLKLLLKWP